MGFLSFAFHDFQDTFNSLVRTSFTENINPYATLFGQIASAEQGVGGLRGAMQEVKQVVAERFDDPDVTYTSEDAPQLVEELKNALAVVEKQIEPLKDMFTAIEGSASNLRGNEDRMKEAAIASAAAAEQPTTVVKE